MPAGKLSYPSRSRTLAFPFLAIMLVAVNQRHECPVASNGVLRRALSNVN